MDAGKRWITVGPPGAARQLGMTRAVGAQVSAMARQGGGRVWLFLNSDDFTTGATRLRQHGARLEQEPRNDPFDNPWDLIVANTISVS